VGRRLPPALLFRTTVATCSSVRPEIRHLPSGTTRIRASKYEPQQLDVHGEDDVLAWLRMSLPTPTLDLGVLHDLQHGVSAAAIDG
jgi:hypothetical protein